MDLDRIDWAHQEVSWETRDEPHGSHSVLPTAEPTSRRHSFLCLEEYLVGEEGKDDIYSSGK